MPSAKIQVDGLREFQSALRSMDRALAKELTAANLKAARLVATEAAGRAPFRTGRLRGSVRALGQQRGATVKAGREAVPYAGPIEFGWADHNIAPQPFLFPALEAKREDVIDIYERLVNELVARHF